MGNELLERATLLLRYANDSYDILRKAMLTDENEVSVKTTDLEGNEVELLLPSISFLNKQIESFQNQMDGLVQFSTGDQTYTELIDVTGQLRALYSVSYDKLPPKIAHNNDLIKIEETQLNDSSDPLTEIFYPWVRVKFDLTSKVKVNANSVSIDRYKLSDATYAILQEQMESNAINFNAMSHESFLSWLEANSNASGYKRIEKRYPIEFSEVRYQGDFSVLSADTSNGLLRAKLSTINYNDKRSNTPMSNRLVINDRLVSRDGSTVFEVKSIEINTNTVVLEKMIGNTPIQAGATTLTYLDQFQNKEVFLPVQYAEKSVVFIAAIDTWYGTVGHYNNPHLLDTSLVYVIDGTNKRYTVDEFLEENNAVDVGSYIRQLITESNNTAEGSDLPKPPSISSANFEIGVINDHIINNADSKTVKKLVANKSSAQIKLDKTNNEIITARRKVDSGQYKNVSERKALENNISTLSKRAESELVNFRSIVTSISESSAVKVAARSYSPKYRVQGMWAENEDDVSHYIVQYRYVAKSGEVANAKSKTISEDSTDAVGIISPWNMANTEKRKKIVKDGVVVWETNDISNADQININQVEVPISVGEDIQFRIKTVLTKGQPHVSVESDWSEIVTVEFPSSLESIQDLSTIEADLQKDLRLLEMEAELEAKGLLKISTLSFYENTHFYALNAINVASGFYTDAGNNINLYDKLQSMQLEVERLAAILSSTQELIDIQLVDQSGQTYSLQRDGLTSIIAGYYTSSLGDGGVLGDIVTKNYYLKITNVGQSLQKIYSLISGDPTQEFSGGSTEANQHYYNVPIGYVIDSDTAYQLPMGKRQYHNMIAYQRSRNFANNADIVDQSGWTFVPNTTTATSNLTEDGAGEYYIYNGSTYVKANLTTTGNVNFTMAVHKSHPAATQFEANGDASQMHELFANMGKMFMIGNNDISMGFSNPSNDSSPSPAKVMYDSDDKYLIGQPSVGAYITMAASTRESLQVEANNAYSGKIIQTGESNSINVPIIYQYRMADYSQAIGGLGADIGNPKEYEVSKIIGIDLLILGQVYKYDIRISSRYTPKSLSTASLPSSGGTTGGGSGL